MFQTKASSDEGYSFLLGRSHIEQVRNRLTVPEGNKGGEDLV